MRGRHMAVAVLVAAGAAIGVAGTVHADNADDGFVNMLKDRGVYVKSNSDAIRMGKSVCLELGRQGTDPGTVLRNLMKTSGMGLTDGTAFVGAAVAAYCPSKALK
jgi:hypothetical protein